MEGEGKMREWFKKNDVLPKALAILLAIFLWFFVLSVDNPERVLDKRDIEVSLIGEITLTAHNLAIADKEVPEIDLKLSGTLSRLADVTENNIVVRSDVSKITEPGVYELPFDVSVIDGITIVSRNPSMITITVEEIVTKELPIKVNIIGELGDNLETDKAIVDPLTVTVRGLSSEIEHASHAVVNVEANEITQTFHNKVDYTIVDGNNKEIKASSIEKIDRKIDLEIPVYLVKELELAIDIIDGNEVTSSDAKVSIDPAKITVIGDIKDVEPLERIVLGTVDLNTFLQNFSSVMAITLPENVIVKENISEAIVNVTLPNIETSLISVDNIILENVHKDYDVTVETISVVITLRGENGKLRNITDEKISLVVDMQNKKPKIGRNLYEAKVEFTDDVSNVGVYGKYNVVVSAAEKTIDVESGELPTEET